MVHVYAEVKIGDPRRKKIITRRMLVDTGATYTSIPYQLAEELDLPFITKTKVIMADGGEVEAEYSAAYIEINGRGDVKEIRVFIVPHKNL